MCGFKCRKGEFSYKGGIFKYFPPDTFIPHRRITYKKYISVEIRMQVRRATIELIYGNNIPLVREMYDLINRRCNNIHYIEPRVTKEKIIVKYGINHLDFNRDCLSFKL